MNQGSMISILFQSTKHIAKSVVKCDESVVLYIQVVKWKGRDREKVMRLTLLFVTRNLYKRVVTDIFPFYFLP